jgi:glutamine synthetase type III
MAKAPAWSGMFFFQMTGVPAFFSNDWHRTASNASSRAIQGLFVATGLQGIVEQLLSGVHGFAER